ncbi:MAG: uracil-DNA glycosylase, partial [Gammaproteobacteria bacterium]|nr:uracil-DNA glycosylase [Gammaproteobacteria bacterium]
MSERIRVLQDIGVRVWVSRTSPVDEQQPTARATVAAAGSAEETAQLDWDGIVYRASRCTACDLHRGRTQAVIGTGDRNADWMIIGEAPGAEEDRRGEPFVGRAGQLLNNMLLAAGFKRPQVYIANIVKCRPPNNRDPRADEAASCAPFLRRQIELVQPKMILAVG